MSTFSHPSFGWSSLRSHGRDGEGALTEKPIVPLTSTLFAIAPPPLHPSSPRRCPSSSSAPLCPSYSAIIDSCRKLSRFGNIAFPLVVVVEVHDPRPLNNTTQVRLATQPDLMQTKNILIWISKGITIELYYTKFTVPEAVVTQKEHFTHKLQTHNTRRISKSQSFKHILQTRRLMQNKYPIQTQRGELQG
jgi:hypothetical protein